jgi:hypothetical protein
MYGLPDMYGSPHNSADQDAGLDEFGLFEKLRAKQKEKKIATLLGKLKELYEKGRLDKCKKHAEKLAEAVEKMAKLDEGWEPDEETQAWVAFGKGEISDPNDFFDDGDGVDMRGEVVSDAGDGYLPGSNGGPGSFVVPGYEARSVWETPYAPQGGGGRPGPRRPRRRRPQGARFLPRRRQGPRQLQLPNLRRGQASPRPQPRAPAPSLRAQQRAQRGPVQQLTRRPVFGPGGRIRFGGEDAPLLQDAEDIFGGDDFGGLDDVGRKLVRKAKRVATREWNELKDDVDFKVARARHGLNEARDKVRSVFGADDGDEFGAFITQADPLDLLIASIEDDDDEFGAFAIQDTVDLQLAALDEDDDEFGALSADVRAARRNARIAKAQASAARSQTKVVRQAARQEYQDLMRQRRRSKRVDNEIDEASAQARVNQIRGGGSAQGSVMPTLEDTLGSAEDIEFAQSAPIDMDDDDEDDLDLDLEP